MKSFSATLSSASYFILQNLALQSIHETIFFKSNATFKVLFITIVFHKFSVSFVETILGSGSGICF